MILFKLSLWEHLLKTDHINKISYLYRGVQDTQATHVYKFYRRGMLII